MDRKALWQKQIERLIERKKEQQFALELVMQTRFAPCSYFSGLTRSCRKGRQVDWLDCSEYEPHETPGPLEKAICEYETGKTYHIMQYAESDGFYRKGRTLCGREVNEELDNVEINDYKPERKLCQYCAENRTDSLSKD